MKKSLSHVLPALGYPLWVLATFVVSALVVGAIARPLGSSLTNDGFIIAMVVLSALIYGLALAMVLLLPRPPRHNALLQWRENLGLMKRPTWLHAGKAALLYPAYFGTLLVTLLILKLVWPGLIDLEQAQEIGYDPETFSSWYQYVLAFIGLVVLPPLFEEMLFRGYLFGKLRARFSGRAGFWVSALITSVLFGFVHGQWNVGIDTFILSLYLCYLREWTGSLWPAIMLHAFKNGLAYILLFIAPLLGWQLVQ